MFKDHISVKGGGGRKHQVSLVFAFFFFFNSLVCLTPNVLGIGCLFSGKFPISFSIGFDEMQKLVQI